jgi:CspA family cold shock protein
MKGSIVRKRDEGYGFIKPEGDDKDVFFHASALVETEFDELNEGDVVTFDIEEGPKGPAAANVTKVEGETATEETPAEEAPATEEVAEETPVEGGEEVA